MTVLEEIVDERGRQDEKFGADRDLPMHAPTSRPLTYLARERFWKRENDTRVREGRLAWDGVLLEEVYEALAERDPARQRAELVQVAAVAVAAIEALDRRRE